MLHHPRVNISKVHRYKKKKERKEEENEEHVKLHAAPSLPGQLTLPQKGKGLEKSGVGVGNGESEFHLCSFVYSADLTRSICALRLTHICCAYLCG
ncbi:hypothetical protein AKJ16_DCAP22872 [Drosera capensis]